MNGDIFDCHTRGQGATGIEWVIKDAAKHSTMCRAAPYNKLTTNVSTTEIKKHRPVQCADRKAIFKTKLLAD